MKIIRKDFVRNGPGSVKMMAEDSDDLWYTYNLIGPEDSVMAITFRKVGGEGRDSTPSLSRIESKDLGKKRSFTRTERVKLKLEVQVEEVDYDKDGDVMRIRGKNIMENEHVRIGAFHTLEIELKRPFLLRKENWDSLALDTLKQASDLAASADLAHGAGTAGYESVLKKFFENVVQAFLKHVDFSVVRCAVIASPGFTKDQFHRHLLLEAERRQLRPILENKSRFILVHTNSGYKHSLSEVLHDPNVMNMIKDTKAAKEVKALNDFFTMFSNDPNRACYGPKHVEVAHERMAIQTLLIIDGLFRNSDVKTRKKYVDFVESVKDSGGEVFIFSSMHASGEQLAQHTGIAAILRFPLPDLEDIEISDKLGLTWTKWVRVLTSESLFLFQLASQGFIASNIMEKEVDKKFVWVIKDLNVFYPKQSHSDPFLIAGSRWRLLALPKGTNYEFFYQYMGVADSCQSLTSSWRRHVKLRLTIVNGISHKRSIVTDSDLYFDENLPACSYPTVPPPFNLLARDAGFLICREITIVIEVVSLEVIGTSNNDGAKSIDLLKQTQQIIDVNGFQVLPSQVESVKCIFEIYPNIASEVPSMKPCLKTLYMNVLLGIIETLCQLPAELSDTDLDEASIAVLFVSQGGFKVDWLEKKLKEVKEKKKKVDNGKARLQQIEEDLQKLNQKRLDLKDILDEEKANDLTANVPLSFNDVLKMF
ncbi:unnamed protein product [Arabidopsis thaliana]|uniref:MATH domain-containing protein n=2 Tax=Arabidopsis thaliana TaxID=3702 RepID=A0A5S9XMM3_ARATH|nr:unnamed protein product [Arabidopsis thaliana]